MTTNKKSNSNTMKTYTAAHKEPEAPKSLQDSLLAEAEKCDRSASQLKGCSFMGQWPGQKYLELASLLRQAAWRGRSNN